MSDCHIIYRMTVCTLSSSINRSGMSLLKYLESPGEDSETSLTSGAGLTTLQAVLILANGPESLVTCMTACNLTSVLVRCLHLFISLPSPGGCGLILVLYLY